MNSMGAVIVISLEILAVFLMSVLLVAIFAVSLKTGVEYKLDIKNFDFKFDFSLIICGKKLILKKKEKKQNDTSDNSKISENHENKSKRKITFSDICDIKDSVWEILGVLLEISEKRIIFEEFKTNIVSALDNPAANGILYGGLHAVLNAFYAQFLAKCNVKNSELKINYDFTSSNGLIAENYGKIYVRPIVVLASAVKILICRKEIRNHIKKLIKFFSK